MLHFRHEQFVDLILDSIADGVFTVDKEFRITSFNRAAEEITKFSRDERLANSAVKSFVPMSVLKIAPYEKP